MVIKMILVITLFFGFVAWSMYWIFKTTRSIYHDINDIKKRAKATTSKKELEDLYEELKLVSKRSFHKEISSEIREVKVLLETKYEYLDFSEKN